MNRNVNLRLRNLAALAALLTLLALPTSAIAQEKPGALNFNLDPATTQIHWTLNTSLHTVHGTFKLKQGAVHIDPASGDASGLIVIDAASGESGDSSRDKRMNTVVLETEKYPTITFRPTHVEGKVDTNAAGPVTVNGVMNLHGQDHPMQLNVSLHPQNSAAITSESHFIIPFVAWGMKDPSIMMFRTDKQVALDISATAIPTSDAAHSMSSVARPILRPSETRTVR